MTSLIGNKFVRVLTLVLIAQAILFYTASRGESAINSAPLSAFPTRIGPWSLLSQGIIEQEELDVLKADDTLTRVYRSPEGVASLFIAYFKTQRTGQSPHSPKNCLPGSGWQPSSSGTEDVAMIGGETIHINRYLVSKGETQSLVLYWYQSHGHVIADEFKAKFYLIEDSIREHRSDTSLVRVVVPFPQNGNEDQIGTDFVKTFYPAIKGYLPK
jgi:EpsI family protein